MMGFAKHLSHSSQFIRGHHYNNHDVDLNSNTKDPKLKELKEGGLEWVSSLNEEDSNPFEIDRQVSQTYICMI